MRPVAFTAVVCVLFLTMCSQAQTTPGTAVSPGQPDKVLFERAMEAMKNSRYAVARTQLQKLIINHPDSDLVPRAKLSIGDAWYGEGQLRRAAMEYRDFITFFPNRPEVAQAQSRVEFIEKHTNNSR